MGNANAVQKSTVSLGVNNGLQFASGIGSFNAGGLAGPGNLTLADTAGVAVAFNVGNNGSNVYSGVLSGAGSLTATGTGSLTLSNSNSTYTGGTTVSGGTLSVSSFASNGLTTPNSGLGAAPNKGVNSSLGMLTLENNATLVYTGPAVGTGGGGVGIYRQINLNGSSATINIGSELAISAAVTSGTLTKMGAGTLDFSYFPTAAQEVDNTNLYVNVQQGTVDLDHFQQAGTAAVYGITNVSVGAKLTDQAASSTGAGGDGEIAPGGSVLSMNGTMDLVYNNMTINTLTGSGLVTASGGGTYTPVLTLGSNNGTCEFDGVIQNGSVKSVSLVWESTGTLTLTGSNTYIGDTTISAGVLQLGTGNAGQDGSIAGNIVDNATLAYNLNGAQTYSGKISGTGGLTMAGVGTLTLTPGTAGNTFSGTTLVAGGTLVLGTPLALQQSTFDPSGTGSLSFGSQTTATFGGLINGPVLDLDNAIAQPVALAVGNNGTSTTYWGALTGSGGLTKVGAGMLTLTGTSTYLGGTTISGGVLAYSTSNALPVGLITIGPGGAIAATPIHNPATTTPVSDWLNDGPIAASPSGAIALTNGTNDNETITLSSTSSVRSAGRRPWAARPPTPARWSPAEAPFTWAAAAAL